MFEINKSHFIIDSTKILKDNYNSIIDYKLGSVPYAIYKTSTESIQYSYVTPYTITNGINITNIPDILSYNPKNKLHIIPLVKSFQYFINNWHNNHYNETITSWKKNIIIYKKLFINNSNRPYNNLNVTFTKVLPKVNIILPQFVDIYNFTLDKMLNTDDVKTSMYIDNLMAYLKIKNLDTINICIDPYAKDKEYIDINVLDTQLIKKYKDNILFENKTYIFKFNNLLQNQKNINILYEQYKMPDNVSFNFDNNFMSPDTDKFYYDTIWPQIINEEYEKKKEYMWSYTS